MMKAREGQALIEFTLTVPIILALFLGIAAFGVIFYTYVTIDHMAREGVAYMQANALYLDEWNREHPDQIDKPLLDYIRSKAGFLDTTEPHPMKITIWPPPDQRMPGGPFEVTVAYTTTLTTIKVPNVFGEGDILLLPPLRLKATASSFFE